MLISHLHKFIYLKSKKTAGTSVEIFLQKYCIDPNRIKDFNKLVKSNKNVLNLNGKEIESKYGIIGSRDRRMHKKNKIWYHHKSAKDIKNEIGKDLFNNYLKICNVRNPYDLAVSMYEWKKSQNNIKESFSEFLLNTKWQDKLRSNIDIWSIDGKYKFEYIRFENLEEDILKVLKKLNIKKDSINLQHYKKMNRLPYQEYYKNQESIDIVSRIYKKEIELFNYKF